jgi:hypothetical protein
MKTKDTPCIQLMGAVSDYLTALDERIAQVAADISAAVADEDEDRVRALRAELLDLDGLYNLTEGSTDWSAERLFRREYGGAS